MNLIKKKNSSCLVVVSLAALTASPYKLNAAQKAEGAELLFAKNVLPLLQTKCFGCHGDDPKRIRGDLDMRSLAGLLKGGESGPALVRGQPRNSLLLRAVLRNTDLIMPPKERNALSKSEIAVLRKWIAAKAPWPNEEKRKELLARKWTGPKDGVRVKTSGGLSAEWTNRRYDPKALWAFQPIQKVAVPWSALPNGATKHPIDAFVWRKLNQKKLKTAPQTDKRSLVRRVTYDLTGLPPTPPEVDAFVNDKSANAYAKLVEQLLASKHYGERMAQHWLDVTRYADSDGYSRDTFRKNAWKYRQYVIASFNSDKPYNRFIMEQIAGDELRPYAPPMQSAVAYLWMGPWEHTGMSVKAVTRQLWLDDVTHSVGVTFLGQSLRCCKCHDHKFDPIPTRDYYRMQAIFASTSHAKQKGRLRGDYFVSTQKPQPVSILKGGALEAPGDSVETGVLSVVPNASQFDIPSTQGGRRLMLAKWIADPKNPLTSRVIVNRVWQWHFGKGLVATPNDFGKMGARPTHPELLDWLAKTFIDQGWSFRKLHRLITTSEVYKRSSLHPIMSKVQEVDTKNELLSWFPPRRLSAEELCDSMLAISGELNRKIGGPSNCPEINWEIAFQPRLGMGRLWAPYEPNAKKSERNRRTLYAVRLRNLPHPFLESFNRPGSETSCPKRDETTVAPQAFTLFKSDWAHNRALAFADRIVKSEKTKEKRIHVAFRLTYGRLPTDKETRICMTHLDKMTAHHREHKPNVKKLPTSVTLEDVKERTGEVVKHVFQLKRLQNYERDLTPWQVGPETRAMAELCLVLFNSSEFLYVY